MGKIGFTTTIPQEIIWASGNIPVDLNNVFVSSLRRDKFLAHAQKDGYPRTSCPWISGIYGAVVEEQNIDALVVVTQGDCSNTHALAETLEDKGLRIIPFAFPYDGDRKLIRDEMLHLAKELGADWNMILDFYKRLKKPRELAFEVDRLTWQENLIAGKINHMTLVTSSDFDGNIDEYTEQVKEIIESSKRRKPFQEKVRLGYIGVPPIFPDIFDECERIGGRVVFCEIQRQFALPGYRGDFVHAYAKYTYPLSVFKRIEDIKTEISLRGIHGIIHYVQSFCFRGIEDILFRKHLDVPILTIEGESSFELDERTKLRIEAFIKMLDKFV